MSKSSTIRDVIYSKKEAFCMHEILMDAREKDSTIRDSHVNYQLTVLKKKGLLTVSAFNSTCKYSGINHSFYMLTKPGEVAHDPKAETRDIESTKHTVKPASETINKTSRVVETDSIMPGKTMSVFVPDGYKVKIEISRKWGSE